MNDSSYRGLGLFSVLTIIFVTLKVTGLINWSWLLVLLPFYGPLSFVILIVIIAFLAIKSGSR